MAGAGVCILFLIVFAVAAFAINVVLPIYILYTIVKWIIRYSKTGELPWHRKPKPEAPAGQEPGLEASFARARAEAAEKEAVRKEAARPEVKAGPGGLTAAAKAEEEVRVAEALLKRKREELAAAMKEQGRLDRLALVYYVEAALRDGCAAAAVALALREKGWPEADITAAFQACGAEPA